MIVGMVGPRREAIVALSVVDPNGQAQTLSAVVDTGFNGFLTLPLTLIIQCGFPLIGRGRAILASGAEETFDIYAATILWHGKPLTVDADAADTDPLVGMALLDGSDLHINARIGGTVTITLLSP